MQKIKLKSWMESINSMNLLLEHNEAQPTECSSSTKIDPTKHFFDLQNLRWLDHEEPFMEGQKSPKLDFQRQFSMSKISF